MGIYESQSQPETPLYLQSTDFPYGFLLHTAKMAKYVL